MQAMQLVCPRCRNCYTFTDHGTAGAGFRCWRCGKELRTPTGHTHQSTETTNSPPPISPLKRPPTRIFRWLALILAVVAGSGFAFQQDAWLDNNWFRSRLMQLGMPVPASNKDWQIDPTSIRTRWLPRFDGQRVLLIQGSITNQLDLQQAMPLFSIRFSATAGADQQQIDPALLHAIQQPDDERIKNSHYLNPAWDLSTLPAGSSHPFTLLVQTIPESSREITLDVAVTVPTRH